MKPPKLLLITLLLTSIFGCNQASDNMSGFSSQEEMATTEAMADYDEAGGDSEGYYAEEEMQQSTTSEEQPATTTPKIIRTGSMSMEVEDYTKARAQLTEVLAPFDV